MSQKEWLYKCGDWLVLSASMLNTYTASSEWLSATATGPKWNNYVYTL